MDNSLKKLNKLFDEVINEKDYDKFFSAITRYFRFIKDTYPLNGIADTLFSSSSAGILIKNIGKLYNVIINHQQFDASVAIDPHTVKGSGLISFHTELVNNLNKQITPNGKNMFERNVIFHKEEQNNSVYLSENPSSRYSMKGKNPQRFEILIALLKSKNGMSVSSLAESLWKENKGKTTQQTLKQEIEEINGNFQKKCKVTKDLISTDKSAVKNIYYLNKKEYNFLLD